MKPVAECFSMLVPVENQALPNAGYAGLLEGTLRSLKGTAEFESFRPILMDQGIWC